MRDRRKELGLTQYDVAADTGLSVPFLSQVENSNAAPSLVSLFAIAKALRTTPERLLAGPRSDEVVHVPCTDGQRYRINDSKQVAYRRQLSGLQEPFSVAEYVLESGAEVGGFQASAGREMIHVTAGCLVVDLQSETGETNRYELNPGDTLTYHTAVPHRWTPTGPKRTRFVHVACDHPSPESEH